MAHKTRPHPTGTPKPRVYRGGRKPILNKDVVNLLVGFVKDGLHIVDACNRSGVSHDRYFQWMQAGRALLEDEPHPQIPESRELQELCMRLYLEVTMAEPEKRRVAMKTMVKAAKNGDVRAAIWLLESTGVGYTAQTRHILEQRTRTDVNVKVALNDGDIENARKVLEVLTQFGITPDDIGLNELIDPEQDAVPALESGETIYSDQAD